METALSVFVNGIAGVFAAMGVLYVTVRINARLAGNSPEKPEQP